jgi:hypothetical protein
MIMTMTMGVAAAMTALALWVEDNMHNMDM